MLRQRSSLDLSRVTDLTQLERDASPAGRLALAAPVAAPAQMAPPPGLGLALPAAGAGSTAESAERAERAERVERAERAERMEVPIEVEAVPIPVSAQCSPARQRVRLPGVNLLSGLLPSSLSFKPRAVAAPHDAFHATPHNAFHATPHNAFHATPTPAEPYYPFPAPAAPWSPSSGYPGALATPLGAATAQAAPLPAAATAEVRKDWTELEDEEILRRRPAPRAPRPVPRALCPAPHPRRRNPCHLALPYRAELPPRAAVLTMAAVLRRHALLPVCRGVAELGLKWRTIAGRLPGRSDDAVRNRWKRLAKVEGAEQAEPNRRPPRAAWSLEEDQTIVEMVARLGFKWGKIEQARRDNAYTISGGEPASKPASRRPHFAYLLRSAWIEQVLEGRTPQAIRNRFYRLQQQQQELRGPTVPGQMLGPV